MRILHPAWLLLALTLPAGALGSDPFAKPFAPPAAGKAAKRLAPRLPKGIVIESTPFDTLIRGELKPFDPIWPARRQWLESLSGSATLSSIRKAFKTIAKEQATLRNRVADVEEQYGEVYNRGYMESSESARSTRRVAAVLIPLYRTLQLRDEGLTAAAVTTLTRADAKTVIVASRSDPDPRLRGAAAEALAGQGGAEALTALRQVLASDRDARVRSRALGALLAWKTPEVKDAVIAALKDPAWNVRALAIEICVRAELTEAVGALIETLAVADGRLRADLKAALQRLTKAQLFGDVEAWRRWWADNRARIEAEAAQRGAGQPVGPPWTWERADEAAADEGKQEAHTSAFYGIPIVSKRIIFVIDISRSMESDSESKPSATKREKTRYPNPRGNAKLDVARWQIHRAIEALPKDAHFNVVVYSESYATWQDEMTLAKKSAKTKAHRFVDGLVANGVTNIADSLDKAFDLAGFGPPDPKDRSIEPAADTIYLLSDGDPNRGRVTDLTKLLDEITRRNAPGRGGLVIHAVGIGEVAGSGFLKSLAERNGGRYVGYK